MLSLYSSMLCTGFQLHNFSARGHYYAHFIDELSDLNHLSNFSKIVLLISDRTRTGT